MKICYINDQTAKLHTFNFAAPVSDLQIVQNKINRVFTFHGQALFNDLCGKELKSPWIIRRLNTLQNQSINIVNLDKSS